MTDSLNWFSPHVFSSERIIFSEVNEIFALATVNICLWVKINGWLFVRYRRKEANARERQRQGEINTGFDKLREKIPHPGPSNGKCEKLRKIDILHVAIEYIR